MSAELVFTFVTCAASDARARPKTPDVVICCDYQKLLLQDNAEISQINQA